MKRSTAILFTCLVLGGMFFLLAFLAPLTSDDLGFSCRLKSWSDIFGAATYLSKTWDGRIGAYLLNHMLLFLPHPLSSAVLAAAFVCLLLLVCMHALGPDWRTRLRWTHLCCAFCALWLSVPAFGEAFFWRTGAIYSVIPMLLLLYLWPYRLLTDGKPVPRPCFWLLIPFAGYLGLSDFNTSVVAALLALAACALTLARRLAVPVSAWLSPMVLLAGFYVSYTMAMHGARLQVQTAFAESSLPDKILRHLTGQGEIQGYYLLPYLLIALSLWLLFRNRNRPLPGGSETNVGLAVRFRLLCSRLRDEPALFWASAFLLAGQAAQWAFMFAPSPAKRAYTSSVIFMIMAALAFTWHAVRKVRPNALPALKTYRLIWVPAFFLCILNLAMAIIMFTQTRAVRDILDARAAAAPQGAAICLPPLPYRSGQYLYFGIANFVTDNPASWLNTGYAQYFGLSTVVLCPQSFTLDLKTPASDMAFHGTVTDSTLRFRYEPLPENAGKPFALVFPLPPRNLLRKFTDDLLAAHMPDSWLFKYIAAKSFTRVRPETLADGKALTGVVALPHLEHTGIGYLAYYDGKGKKIVSLIPLAIHRDAPPPASHGNGERHALP